MRDKGPWGHGPPWSRHGRRPEERAESWSGKRRFIFLRFAAVFGFMVLFVLGGMAALAFLLANLFGGDGRQRS